MPRIGVVGLGTAGSAVSIFLAREGHAVTLFEKTAQQSLFGAGAGIGLQPIGLRVLQRLGLLEPILQRGHKIDRLHAVNERGHSVLDLKYADFRSDLFGVGLHRDVLFTELHSAAQAEPNIEIVYDFEVTDLEIAGSGGYTHNSVISAGRREGLST